MKNIPSTKTIADVDEALRNLPTVEQLMAERQERNIDPDREFCKWWIKKEKLRLAYIRKSLEMQAEQKNVFDRYQPDLKKLHSEYEDCLSNPPHPQNG